ncbi:hypothetical protein [Nonomuraea sp. NPDC003201]
MVLVLMATVLAGCAAPRQEQPQDPAVRLEAALVSPTDVALRWRGRDPGAAGHVIEFATEPQGPYTILGFLPPEQTAYTHPDLMPRTTFHYRLPGRKERSSRPSLSRQLRSPP